MTNDVFEQISLHNLKPHNLRSRELPKLQSIIMGRNKFSQKELKEIGKLLQQKNSVNRGKQKLIRHQLRVDYEFNISDFNEPGKAFGEEELLEAVKRGAIQVLDDATIAAMKEKRARDKAKDEAARMKEAVEAGEQTDWQEALREWKEWEDKESSTES